MSTVLRRILTMAFIAVLAGLGVFFTALLGRRPRRRVAASAETLVPVLPASRLPARAHGGRGLAVGIVCLLILMGSAGVIYESRNALFGGGSREPDGNVEPLAALSPPHAGIARANGRSDGLATGSVRASSRSDEAVTLQPSRPPALTAPGFDVVRIEPNGDAVIAGHATPNATVELLVDGKPAGRARANANGRFTFMPPALPTGNSEIGLRATDAEGDVRRSPANVSIVVAPNRDAKPLVAVTSPGRPTMVLSQPDRPGTTDRDPVTASDRQARRDEGMPRRGRTRGRQPRTRRRRTVRKVRIPHPSRRLSPRRPRPDKAYGNRTARRPMSRTIPRNREMDCARSREPSPRRRPPGSSPSMPRTAASCSSRPGRRRGPRFGST
ncbi:MAG: hypothetical protein INR70_22940 [Parafilimonas terrae]|nr:hypothetical protein [Parafilimonas terrae]